MNKYCKKIFLFSLIISSVITSSFLNCESINPEAVTISYSKKDAKAICKDRSFKGTLMNVPWRQIAFRYAVFFAVMGTFYTGFKLFREWNSNRSLSKTEQEILWHETILSYLVANVLLSDLMCCSAKDEDLQETQDMVEASAC